MIKKTKNELTKNMPTEMVDEILKYTKYSESDEDEDEDEDEDDIGEERDELFELIEQNGLTNVFLNNYDSDNFSIGFIVDDYEEFSNKDKDKVNKFCKKHKLEKPTFYGGLIGELE